MFGHEQAVLRDPHHLVVLTRSTLQYHFAMQRDVDFVAEVQVHSDYLRLVRALVGEYRFSLLCELDISKLQGKFAVSA